MTRPQLPSVDPREIGDDLLLDVRESDEWAAGHAPGAVHLPLSELQARLAEVPTDRPVAIICKVGGRSGQATAFLNAQGCSTRNVVGGMLAWAQHGLPMEAADGTPRVL